MRGNQSQKRPVSRTSLNNEEETSKKRMKTVSSGHSCFKLNSELNFDKLCDKKVEFIQSGFTRNIISIELAEKSKYFDSLFRYHIGDVTIKLPEFLNQPFSSIIEFIRYGKTALDNENVYSIFLAADFLLLSNLKTMCLEYIREKMNKPSHAISLWISTKETSNIELEGIAFDKILEQFEDVWRCEEFLSLEFGDVKSILSDDGLNNSSELSILQAISRWTNFSVDRTVYSTDLVLCCRFGLLNQTERESIRSMDCISSDSRQQNIVDSWPKFLTQKDYYNELEQFRDKIVSSRNPREIVLVFGGWCDGQGPQQIVQAYDPRAHNWTSWTSSSKTNSIGGIPKRVYAGCIVVDSIVYLIGGFDGNTSLKSTVCYDFDNPNMGWQEISCMYDKRYYVGVAHVNGFIYAVGGHNGEERGRLNTGERYHIKENQWYTISPMNRVRSDASAAELYGKVYICGGFDGRRYHDSAEYYDPANNNWTLISGMISPRGGVTLVRHGIYIYAIGGNNGASRLRSIERYDPLTEQWECAGTMSQQKSNLSAVAVDNDIYIIGGFSDEKNLGILSVVERFDVKKKQCYPVASMTFPASATCACLLSGKHRAMQYVTSNSSQ